VRAEVPQRGEIRLLRPIESIVPVAIRDWAKRVVFKDMLKGLRTETLLKGKLESVKVFCFVHWNAPDFLELSVKQIEALHPESKIYVLDNGSQKSNLDEIKKRLEQFENITLISAKLQYPYRRIWLLGHPISRLITWFGHTIGLQFLLNYSVQQSDETAVFLDQDCILSRRVDPLIDKLSKDFLLVGVRDYLEVPKDYGPLKRKKIRDAHSLVHASFMMLEPRRIQGLFGNTSLFGERGVREPYQGICHRVADKILYLETKMHEEIPFLTSYSFRGVTFAWHAWYSSRTFGRSNRSSLDGLPVSWIREVRKLSYNYMKKIYEETITRRKRRLVH
jgi:hypothetical protein